MLALQQQVFETEVSALLAQMETQELTSPPVAAPSRPMS